MQLLLQSQLRELEQQHVAATPSLMERAGRAAAQLAVERYGVCRVLICAGPGNNGGDGFVMARELAKLGCPVTTLRDNEDVVATGDYGLVVDALFGIGLTRPIEGRYAALVERINAFAGPVMALDVPSGLDADTGTVQGSAVHADATTTFIAAKPGLYTAQGPDHCGEICVLDLDLALAAGPGAILDRTDFSSVLTPRQRHSHKGSYGTLAVIGGAPGMAGAALLAGRAALILGAGRVMVGMLERLSVDPTTPELMLRAPNEALAHATVAVVGPGLGQSDSALELLRRLASTDFSLLLDADALNLMAVHAVLADVVAQRNAPTLMTPHPTEAARLLGTDTAAIQSDRIAAALTLASRFNACIALKGVGTVLAHPDGRWRINTTGNPGLASGGTGDVLTGMAGALLAQGAPAWEALCAAVHLHGAAADAAVESGHGPVGLTASELLVPARKLLNRWIAELA
jgi:hydroxyethylthiazole kinase-like uncharacterized protein yjeF